MSENPPLNGKNPMETMEFIAKSLGEPSAYEMLNKSLREVLLNEGGMLNKNKDVFNSLYLQRSKLTSQQRNILYNDCAILKQSISKLVMEQYRNGIVIGKAFEKVCTVCDQQYQADIETCDATVEGELCGGETRDPNKTHFERLTKVMKNSVNQINHDLETVGTQLAIDVEKHDYATAVVQYQYITDDSKKRLAINEETREYERTYKGVYRGDSTRIYATLSFVKDPLEQHYKIFLVCPTHRNYIKPILENEIDTIHVCDRDDCKMELELAEYVLLEQEQSITMIEGYLVGEVIRISKYDPAQLRGNSKIDTLIYAIIITIGQEKMMAEYAMDKRVPRGFFTMKVGGNYDQVRRNIEQEMEMFRRDPSYVPMFPMGKDGEIIFHKIDDSPLEMGWEAIREEQRNTISSSYGINKMFTNDASTGGGLNNDGLMMVVTNRAVATAHKVNNHSLWKPLSSKILGVPEEELEYYFEHADHEEMDKMAELMQEQQKMSNMQMAQNIGADVVLGEDGELTMSNPIPNQALVPMNMQAQLGGMGDMGGMQDLLGGMEGAPAVPDNEGGSDVMAKSSTKFARRLEYDFPGNENYDYTFVKFKTINLSEVVIPIGYRLSEPLEHPSSTMDYFVDNPEIIPAMQVDEENILLDGYHRLKACEKLGKDKIVVSVWRDNRLLKARSWEDYTYAEQTAYVQEHKQTKRTVTKSPDGDKAEQQEIPTTPQSIVDDKRKISSQLIEMKRHGYDEDSQEVKVLMDLLDEKTTELDDKINDKPVDEETEKFNQLSEPEQTTQNYTEFINDEFSENAVFKDHNQIADYLHNNYYSRAISDFRGITHPSRESFDRIVNDIKAEDYYDTYWKPDFPEGMDTWEEFENWFEELKEQAETDDDIKTELINSMNSYHAEFDNEINNEIVAVADNNAVNTGADGIASGVHIANYIAYIDGYERGDNIANDGTLVSPEHLIGIFDRNTQKMLSTNELNEVGNEIGLSTPFSDTLQKRAKLNWDDMSYTQQVKYLQSHPKSQRRITAKPDDKAMKMIESKGMSRKNIMAHLVAMKRYQNSLKASGMDTKVVDKKVKEFQSAVNVKTEKHAGVLKYHAKKATEKKMATATRDSLKLNEEYQTIKDELKQSYRDLSKARRAARKDRPKSEDLEAVSTLSKQSTVLSQKAAQYQRKFNQLKNDKELYDLQNNVTGEQATAFEISHYEAMLGEGDNTEIELKIDQLKKMTDQRVDGTTWEFYDSSVTTPYDTKFVDDINFIFARKGRMSVKHVQPLFDSEKDYCLSRLGYKYENLSDDQKTLLDHLSLTVNAKLGKNTNGHYSPSQNEIRVSSRMKSHATEIQQTIRHELAHFFQGFNDPNMVKAELVIINRQKFLEEYGVKSGKGWRLNNQSQYADYYNFNKQLSDLNYETISREKHEGSGYDFNVGHGQAWQDTMQVLFGEKPKSRFHDSKLTENMQKQSM